MEICCTCARPTTRTPGPEDSFPTEKGSVIPVHGQERRGEDIENEKLRDDRRLACCGRVICGRCIRDNARLGAYCPFCQVTSGPSALPQRLRDPPSYFRAVHVEGPGAPAQADEDAMALAAQLPPPPPYSASRPLHDSDSDNSNNMKGEKKKEEDVRRPELEFGVSALDPAGGSQDTVHFLDHSCDTVASLALRYGVPPAVLRSANRLTSDHLLGARRAVRIPGTHYRGGVSLSPQPPGGEEAEERKARIRRWQVTCKVADYDVAVLYLEQARYDLDAAVGAYLADEAWERDHPLPPNRGGVGGRGAARAKKAGKRTLFGNMSWA